MMRDSLQGKVFFGRTMGWVGFLVLVAGWMVCAGSAALMSATSSFGQELPKKNIRVIDNPLTITGTINDLISGKTRLGASELLMFPGSFSAFQQKIKYIGQSEQGVYLTSDVFPASPKFWVCKKTIDVAKLEAKMALGDLLKKFDIGNGKSSWHIIEGESPKEFIEQSKGLSLSLIFRAVAIDGEFLEFVTVTATVPPSETSAEECMVIIGGCGVVRLNTHAPPQLSPYGDMF